MIYEFSGPLEVDILERKLKESKIKDANHYKLPYNSLFFKGPGKRMESEFSELVEDISSWPTVSISLNHLSSLGIGQFKCKKLMHRLSIIFMKKDQSRCCFHSTTQLLTHQPKVFKAD